ncbi:hypothetical protein A2U01_0098342, partial [Trifolium medium]|nr:hypothetical protein [Trifolium medium]
SPYVLAIPPKPPDIEALAATP